MERSLTPKHERKKGHRRKEYVQCAPVCVKIQLDKTNHFTKELPCRWENYKSIPGNDYAEGKLGAWAGKKISSVLRKW